MMLVSTRTIAESQSVATPRDCCFDVFRGRLESAAQLDRLRQFRPRGLRCGDPFANQLRDRVLELFVLMHRANFYRAHEVIWKIEGSLHYPARFPEIWFSVNGAASARRRRCRSSLCFVKNLLYQRVKTRLVANAVVDLVDLKILTNAVLLLVPPFLGEISAWDSKSDSDFCRSCTDSLTISTV